MFKKNIKNFVIRKNFTQRLIYEASRFVATPIIKKLKQSEKNERERKKKTERISDDVLLLHAE